MRGASLPHCHCEAISDLAAHFIAFICSAQMKAVIVESGYIASVEDARPFAGGNVAGKIVVAGSSSVTPVMEKLKAPYEALNPDAQIELRQSDSSSGMTSTIDVMCDIGMASRDLKESELAAGLIPTVIAPDGIAVIVSSAPPWTRSAASSCAISAWA